LVVEKVHTHVIISAEAHRALKHRAVDEGKSLTRLLSELIEKAAAEKTPAKK
jgi:predicted HicB family RNase H-like nuclease